MASYRATRHRDVPNALDPAAQSLAEKPPIENIKFYIYIHIIYVNMYIHIYIYINMCVYPIICYCKSLIYDRLKVYNIYIYMNVTWNTTLYNTVNSWNVAKLQNYWHMVYTVYIYIHTYTYYHILQETTDWNVTKLDLQSVAFENKRRLNITWQVEVANKVRRVTCRGKKKQLRGVE